MRFGRARIVHQDIGKRFGTSRGAYRSVFANPTATMVHDGWRHPRGGLHALEPIDGLLAEERDDWPNGTPLRPRRTIKATRPCSPSTHRPERTRDHARGGLLECQCWCQREIVWVPRHVVRACRTLSCGQPTCDETRRCRMRAASNTRSKAPVCPVEALRPVRTTRQARKSS